MDRDSILDEEPTTPIHRSDAGDFDPAMTPHAMETLLRGDGDRVTAASRRLSEARQQFEIATDRSRFSTDTGHAGAVAEAEPVLRRAELDAVAVAESAELNARQFLAQLQQPTPPSLADADAPVAAARAPFVREDCADLPIAELTSRVRLAVMTDSRVDQWLYARYAGARTTEAGHHDDLPGADVARRELQTLLGGIRDRLRDRGSDPVRERTTASLRSAQALRSTASARANRRDAEVAIERMIPNAVKIPEEAAR
jgi:hypothetical protein